MAPAYRIGFFTSTKKNKDALYHTNVESGNPGVGGTKYLFLLTVSALNKKYGSDYAVLLTDAELELSDSCIPIAFARDENEAICFCEENAIPFLTLNAGVLDHFPKKMRDTTVRILVWGHNTLTENRQRLAYKTNSIERVVCVSKSQYENMRDTICFDKCMYIHNVIPLKFYDDAVLTDCSEPKAVYVGSVVPQKGVHNLIEIWKYVEEKAPHAQLYIFGGANIWNQNVTLKAAGVADIYYDRVIRRRLSRLKYPENIHFMGARGWNEIKQMITTARVGIVNPSHYLRDETFCMSAVEMEAHGIPVVSRQRKDGLTGTILHRKTGFLEKTDRELAHRIVSLLSDSQLCTEMGAAARRHASLFVVDREIHKWHDVMEEARPVQKKKYKLIPSKDAVCLIHDVALRLGFFIESGRLKDRILKKERM